jgi:anti-anti-sigma factor
VSDLVVDIRDAPTVVEVTLHGSLDLSAYGPVRVDLVERLRGDERDIVIELDDVDYLDSSGVQLLVELAALASRDRRRCVVVMATEQPCRRMLTIAHTDDVLEIVADEATARAALASSVT